MDHLLLY